MPLPIKPVDSGVPRLLLGGGLVFCSAVVVQLLQVPVAQFTTALWVALWSIAIAIPCLAAALGAYAGHERFAVRHLTGYTLAMSLLGFYGTLVCAGAVVWHFAWYVGAGFCVMAFLAMLSYLWDMRYHFQLNAPREDAADL